MTILQQIGQTVGEFLAAKRGAANGFAPTDTNNKLPNSFLNSDVVIKDGTGRIPLSDLPLSVTTGGMVCTSRTMLRAICLSSGSPVASARAIWARCGETT